jgi:hypothetical protein
MAVMWTSQTRSYWYGSGKNQPWLEAPMDITDWTFRGVPEQYFLPTSTSNGVWNSAQSGMCQRSL